MGNKRVLLLGVGLLVLPVLLRADGQPRQPGPPPPLEFTGHLTPVQRVSVSSGVAGQVVGVVSDLR